VPFSPRPEEEPAFSEQHCVSVLAAFDDACAVAVRPADFSQLLLRRTASLPKFKRLLTGLLLCERKAMFPGVAGRGLKE